MDIEQHGTGGVGIIGGMNLSAGQIPDEPSVNGSEKQIAAFCECLRFGDILQNPADFCCGEIGINQKPCFFADFFGVALLLQRITIGCGSSALPDNGMINRLAVALVPEDGGFALVGDADGGNFPCGNAKLGNGIARNRKLCFPDFQSVMLHPAGVGIVLLKFLLRNAFHLPVLVEKNRAGAGCALV